jgi:hypothetical protein
MTKTSEKIHLEKREQNNNSSKILFKKTKKQQHLIDALQMVTLIV